MVKEEKKYVVLAEWKGCGDEWSYTGSGWMVRAHRGII